MRFGGVGRSLPLRSVLVAPAVKGPSTQTGDTRAASVGPHTRTRFVRRTSMMMRADLAVFASSYEPFGLAAAEALAAGVPTVVAKTGGMQTLIEDYQTGFYMQPENEKSLVHIIEWILENEALTKVIGRRAKESIHEKFSWAQNAKDTDTLYTRALSKNGQKEGIR